MTNKLPEGRISMTEIAEIYGVSRDTIRRWADQEKIPSTRIEGGNRQFFRKDFTPLTDDQIAAVKLRTFQQRDLVAAGVMPEYSPQVPRYVIRDKSWAEDYARLRMDPELLNGTDEIAMATAFMKKMLAAFGKEGAEAGDWWKKLVEKKELVRQHNANGEHRKAQTAMKELFKLIEAGSSESEQWADIMRVGLYRDRLIGRELDRRKTMDEFVAAEQFTAWVAFVGQTLTETLATHVQDREQAQEVLEIMSKILSSSSEPE